ncbi:type VII secretion integral membrane protein EccD [Micromonospora echinospora]|uniref:Type VII secretion integral membrane protein EccD n=1 Tax=Micromonospora echinospora TaxID=1877 RepID=A0A1C4ZV46_MICEC|nr:type VII secretion integral membrane protein EccD [Micromonospora echinospora]OZV83944.1 type VII secretion integral membrane protein EccD [Micromonospora echinospora]SCF36833.1 type VII secretion integral membrane protein EccD [Micromonospora echinospora]
MANRFTRVTVVADGRSLDVSLPAARPLVEVLPQLCDLLSLAPQATGRWTLSTPASGGLDPRRSLDEAGVVDAQTLYLTPPEQAALPPFVDDVVDEVQSTVDGDGSEWSGAARAAGCAALAGVVVLVLTYVLATTTAPQTGTTTAPQTAVALAVVAVAAALIGRLLRDSGGHLLVAAAVPAWALALTTAARLAGWDTPAQVTVGVVGAGAGTALLALTGDRWYGVAAGGVTLASFGVAGTALLTAGLDPARAAAVGAVLAVFAVGLAPQLALDSSRLVELLRMQEESRWVGRHLVEAAVRRGEAVLRGTVTGIAGAAAGTALVLLTGDVPSGVLLGGVLGLVFALRSRIFTRRGQVVPMLVVPVVVATVLLVDGVGLLTSAGPGRVWLLVAGGAAAVAVLLRAGRPRLDDVAAARTRQLLDLVEVVAVVSLVPLVIAVFGGFAWAAG